ncbi:hypothetical protein [Dyella choica]|uniref:Uncharacterized protein n=1 Tax=Dyella choica TaxID=1927959 RepID=A0A3S0PR62_9GAMM|nr:hypothetical protein [Dyella choica]RUL79039.1 hypothetical protein EKH80_04370 [Dyella choica]
MNPLTSIFTMVGIALVGARPVVAADAICAERVAVKTIQVGAYGSGANGWGVSIVDNDGNVKSMAANLPLRTAEGEAMLDLLKEARRHNDLVTFRLNNSAACQAEAGAFGFDSITVE